MFNQKIICFEKSNSSCFSMTELKKLGVVVMPGSLVKVDRSVRFNIAPGKEIVLKGNVLIEARALIEAQAENCHIENSHIANKVKITDSLVKNTVCYAGTQIKATKMVISFKGKKLLETRKYLLYLRAGDSHQENNFALTRGAVVKRIARLVLSTETIVPAGQSLVDLKELNEIKNNLSKNDLVLNYCKKTKLSGVYLVNSLYCHPEPFELFYDLVQFNRVTHLQDFKRPKSFNKNSLTYYCPKNKIFYINLKMLDKSSARASAEIQKLIKDLREKSKKYFKLVFINRESGITMVFNKQVFGK